MERQQRSRDVGVIQLILLIGDGDITKLNVICIKLLCLTFASYIKLFFYIIN